jgi:hypothetical protein
VSYNNEFFLLYKHEGLILTTSLGKLTYVDFSSDDELSVRDYNKKKNPRNIQSVNVEKGGDVKKSRNDNRARKHGTVSSLLNLYI